MKIEVKKTYTIDAFLGKQLIVMLLNIKMIYIFFFKTMIYIIYLKH
jgi:glucose-6-phosphate 1-dehydrogenase